MALKKVLLAGAILVAMAMTLEMEAAQHGLLDEEGPVLVSVGDGRPRIHKINDEEGYSKLHSAHGERLTSEDGEVVVGAYQYRLPNGKVKNVRYVVNETGLFSVASTDVVDGTTEDPSDLEDLVNVGTRLDGPYFIEEKDIHRVDDETTTENTDSTTVKVEPRQYLTFRDTHKNIYDLYKTHGIEFPVQIQRQLAHRPRHPTWIRNPQEKTVFESLQGVI